MLLWAARLDADFSGIFVSEMAVGAYVWALSHYNHCFFSTSHFWCYLGFFKFATSQLALPPTEKNNDNYMTPLYCSPPFAGWYSNCMLNVTDLLCS